MNETKSANGKPVVVGSQVTANTSPKFGVPNRPCSGTVLSTELRTSQFGSSMWAKIAFKRICDNEEWIENVCCSDLIVK